MREFCCTIFLSPEIVGADEGDCSGSMLRERLSGVSLVRQASKSECFFSFGPGPEHLTIDVISFQAKRLEAFMVQEEAAKEGLSKEERLRMLKRVIADIKDDFKSEKLEEESGPPKLSSVNIMNINNLIRQKALEMQLTKKEVGRIHHKAQFTLVNL